ncbi:unnamed protein product [Amoebophrya sp. A120]|nr:unnamed protein product [Amoebophrya sp. A120]|eukprot:GSA120T00024452001.1
MAARANANAKKRQKPYESPNEDDAGYTSATGSGTTTSTTANTRLRAHSSVDTFTSLPFQYAALPRNRRHSLLHDTDCFERQAPLIPTLKGNSATSEHVLCGIEANLPHITGPVYLPPRKLLCVDFQPLSAANSGSFGTVFRYKTENPQTQETGECIGKIVDASEPRSVNEIAISVVLGKLSKPPRGLMAPLEVYAETNDLKKIHLHYSRKMCMKHVMSGDAFSDISGDETNFVEHSYVEILHGLHFLHQSDISSNDCKPDNLYLEFDSYGVLRVYLGDFGNACKATQRATEKEFPPFPGGYTLQELQKEMRFPGTSVAIDQMLQAEEEGDKDKEEKLLTKDDYAKSLWNALKAGGPATLIDLRKHDVGVCGLVALELLLLAAGKDHLLAKEADRTWPQVLPAAAWGSMRFLEAERESNALQALIVSPNMPRDNLAVKGWSGERVNKLREKALEINQFLQAPGSRMRKVVLASLNGAPGKRPTAAEALSTLGAHAPSAFQISAMPCTGLVVKDQKAAIAEALEYYHDAERTAAGTAASYTRDCIEARERLLLDIGIVYSTAKRDALLLDQKREREGRLPVDVKEDRKPDISHRPDGHLQAMLRVVKSRAANKKWLVEQDEKKPVGTGVKRILQGRANETVFAAGSIMIEKSKWESIALEHGITKEEANKALDDASQRGFLKIYRNAKKPKGGRGQEK